MALFAKVAMRCNICGCVILTDFSRYGGRFCGEECNEEYHLRRAYAIMGDENPEKKEPYIKKEKYQ